MRAKCEHAASFTSSGDSSHYDHHHSLRDKYFTREQQRLEREGWIGRHDKQKLIFRAASIATQRKMGYLRKSMYV
jgi:hypothetical protein